MSTLFLPRSHGKIQEPEWDSDVFICEPCCPGPPIVCTECIGSQNNASVATSGSCSDSANCNTPGAIGTATFGSAGLIVGGCRWLWGFGASVFGLRINYIIATDKFYSFISSNVTNAYGTPDTIYGQDITGSISCGGDDKLTGAFVLVGINGGGLNMNCIGCSATVTL